MNPRTIRLLAPALIFVAGITNVVHAVTPDADVGLAGTHCAILLAPDHAPDPGPVGPPACFPTFAASLFFATGGAIMVDERLDPRDLTQPLLDGAAEDHVVIGIDHVSTGQTLIWYGHSPCSATVSYSAPSFPPGMSNDIASATAYGDCDRWYHYELVDFGGRSTVCTCSSIMHPTRSERWLD